MARVSDGLGGEELRRCARTQFDPTVIRELTALVTAQPARADRTCAVV
jgi:hypothetical protein